MTTNAGQLLAQIVQEGNWDGPDLLPRSLTIRHGLAVLVTGVNEIRKTTSMYQLWFMSLLTAALVAPAGRKDTAT